jgi:SagB-type dehydrogenase family enzyme
MIMLDSGKNATDKALDIVLEYHTATKHKLGAYARGPGRLDWTNEPNPFRRYPGVELILLDKEEFSEVGRKASLDKNSISKFFYCSLAISAWKSSGGSIWSLRVNPSSGDLHPTEGYLITGPVEGICQDPGLYHYTPEVHGLEHRSRLSSEAWKGLRLPEGAFMIGLSSIYWRESWKYGERAFRYCMLDIGHAIAALSVSASCLGWRTAILGDPGTSDLDALLGTPIGISGEIERADCILAVLTQGGKASISREALAKLRDGPLVGKPNKLSVDHVLWNAINDVAEATVKPSTVGPYSENVQIMDLHHASSTQRFCSFIRSRRSAQSMDGVTHMPKATFYDLLGQTVRGGIAIEAIPWKPKVNLALFVHRVDDLESGLYLLIRDLDSEVSDVAMRRVIDKDFAWDIPEDCPEELNLYLLANGGFKELAMASSCQQDIASDGCFSLAMLAQFEEPLKSIGPWFYPCLHWECGSIGQALYLAAEALGFRGCGIGCFFDDTVHELLGLKTTAFQDLYHFTVGKPVEDLKITTLPPYR